MRVLLKDLKCLRVADYFVRRGLVDGHADLTNMKLNKLAYIAHGWYLGFHGVPLIVDQLQPWDWGPVYPELYYRIKFKFLDARNGKRPDSPIDTEDFFYDEPLQEMMADELLDRVYDLYINDTASSLMELTHRPGSPWSIARENNWYAIPDNIIKEYYERRLKKT